MPMKKINFTALGNYKCIFNRLKYFVKLKKYSIYDRLLDIEVNAFKVQSIGDRNKVHKYMTHYFIYKLPKEIQNHRIFFSKSNRGFGEDAFHAMWFHIFRDFKPINCLEIGVYRGQTLSLWALLSDFFNIESNLAGISPFSNHGDTVSKYDNKIDYYNDTLSNIKHFSSRKIDLCRSFSTEKPAANFMRKKRWDLIYIDGGHDFATVFSDYKLAINNLSKGGVLVLDDSSLFFDFTAPSFSFSGHPGPSKVARDFAANDLKFVFGVGHNNVYIK
jgi:hypothetical protein